MNTITFDAAWNALGETVQALYDAAYKSDRNMAIAVKMVGPAGGNPTITVTTKLDPSDLGITHGSLNGSYFGP
jgi:hypothetical protein